MERRTKRDRLSEAELFIINRFKLSSSKFMYDWKNFKLKHRDSNERHLFYLDLCTLLKQNFSTEWFSTPKDVQDHYRYLRALYTKARSKRKVGGRLTELQSQILSEMNFLDEFIVDKDVEQDQVDQAYKDQDDEQHDIIDLKASSICNLKRNASATSMGMSFLPYKTTDANDDDVIFIEELPTLEQDNNIIVCDKENNVWPTWGLEEHKDVIVQSLKQELNEENLFVSRALDMKIFENAAITESSLAVQNSEVYNSQKMSIMPVKNANENVSVNYMQATKPSSTATSTVTTHEIKEQPSDEAVKNTSTNTKNPLKIITSADNDKTKSQILKEAACKAKIIGKMLSTCNTEKYCHVLIAMMDIFKEHGV